MQTKEIDIRDFLDARIEHFHDRSIRRLFENKENIRGLIEIIATDLAEHIDFSQLAPISRSFIPETLREREADIVFRVPFEAPGHPGELLIYILIEHQSSVDETMGFRVLLYMLLIWEAHYRQWTTTQVPKNERRLPPILPIVFYTGEGRWQTPLTLEAIMDVPEALSRFVPTFDTLFLSVKETEAATLTKTGHPLGWLLTVLQQEKADKTVLSRALVEAVSQLEALDSVERAQRREAIVYLLLLILHRRPVEEHRELVTLVDEYTSDMEVETMAQSMAEVLI
ncbi:MAG: Rpn family recombination-promoting nuclease/putative transposase, partial [Candidatus Poribacteria bacterium]|nr:Rpn family recombination-promoting nuclease/putative transposase [Candidatus Poribacteria bacterium]